MLKKGDDARQLVYYQSGIGTYLPDIKSLSFHQQMLYPVRVVLEKAFAWTIADHIKGVSVLWCLDTHADCMNVQTDIHSLHKIV